MNIKEFGSKAVSSWRESVVARVRGLYQGTKVHTLGLRL
jgi:hypothetical protein